MKIYSAIFLLAAVAVSAHHAPAAEPRINLVCSTYPIRLLTREVTAEVPSVKVDLLVPAETGCPHDYVLTPTDMRRLMRADAVIVNGLGLDEFLNKPLMSVKPDAVIIDTSVGIDDLLPARIPTVGQRHAHGHEDDETHAHHGDAHGDFNPHLFASPRHAARLVMNIAAALSEIDPEHAASYDAAARNAAERLRRLSQDMALTATEFARRKIVTHHNVFDYLAQDLELDVVAVIQGGHGQEPTATELRRLIRVLREHKVAVLITEPQYRDNVVTVLSAETGVPLATLDPLATGPEDADLDYYLTVMRANIEKLQRLLQ